MEACCQVFFRRDKHVQPDQLFPSADLCLEPLAEMKLVDESFVKKEENTLISV